jgi:tol-pal system protein YbgF
MNKLALPAALLLLCTFFFTSCIYSDEIEMLNRRVSAQEQRLNSINSQLSGVQPAQADTWSQVQDLQQEISHLKGRLDMLENNSAADKDIAQITERLNKQEQALRLIASEFAIELPMLDAAAQTPTTQATNQVTNQATTNNETENNTQETENSTATTPASTSETAVVLYEQGVELFNQRDYEGALLNFKDFTDVYPTHTLAGNAWFWQGETNFQLKRYGDAALAYEKVIAKYPKSSKYASAMMKQGICYFSLGNKNASKLRLDMVISEFPGSPEANRAQKFLEKNF